MEAKGLRVEGVVCKRYGEQCLLISKGDKGKEGRRN